MLPPSNTDWVDYATPTDFDRFFLGG